MEAALNLGKFRESSEVLFGGQEAEYHEKEQKSQVMVFSTCSYKSLSSWHGHTAAPSKTK